MWERIAHFVLKNRIQLLFVLAAATGFMAYHASKVQLSYEFTRAIPTNNPKYAAYQDFKKKFGDDGNLMLMGLQTNRLFDGDVFNDYFALSDQLKKMRGVEGVISIASASNLVKQGSLEKLKAVPIFPDRVLSQAEIDSGKKIFFNLPFYNDLLYHLKSGAYLMAINVNKDIMNTAERNVVVSALTAPCVEFGRKHNMEVYLSGSPLIRTNMATRVATETKWFLTGFVLLSAFILFLFFRSFSTMLLSVTVVIIGVVFSLGSIHWFGYKISLLNALIPPLLVVIGVPNCIYFLNKYHSSFRDTRDKRAALIEMIRRMGIVTLFCNIAAGIGFGVFALTKSAILKEFGIVAGINIMLLFFISFILIPIVLSYLPEPKAKHMRYLENKWLTRVLDKLEVWSLHHQKLIYSITFIVLVISVLGILRLRSEAFIVDDLPKTDKIYTDLKFFEKNFRGVMPLEIVIDTKRKNGLRINPLKTLAKIDSLSKYIAQKPEMAKPLSIVEGLKFARQAYYDGDSSSYGLPNNYDIVFLLPYLNTRPSDTSGKKNNLIKLVSSFIDSNNEQTRISVNMADVGTMKLPGILNDIEKKSNQIFDSSKYSIQLTGSSVTFLEGGIFIINGLRDSIIWAFILIAACMLYLFRSFRILLCSLIPNTIPLIITAGVMGWVGVPLKPSTVLVFSIALGIAIDITIRFLVNYKQELAAGTATETETVIATIHSTGISIIYTSLVLITGFAIFCFSNFGGTKSLGWLTSLTLIMATLTNLIFLPALLITLAKKKKSKEN
jgi:predicted RND superfamily exporter protein